MFSNHPAIAAITAGILFLSAQTASADYPNRDIDLIVGYSAGGSTDVLARTLTPYLEDELGGDITINVVNRPGGSGEISFTEIAHAKPDGYTLAMSNMPGIINPLIEREPDYALKDFTFLGNIILDPTAILVNADSEFDSLDQWVENARAHPGEARVGNPGRGGAQHTTFERFLLAAGVEATSIPFNGGSRSRAALMGGHISASSMGLAEAAGNVKSGGIRVLAVMAEQRSDLLPEVPTARELGYDVVGGSYRGMIAPAGLDTEVEARLHDALARAVANPEFREAARKRLYLLRYMSGPEQQRLADTLYQEMTALWEKRPWVDQ
ncbi:tripartite tricarboxylate transporter substrate binding protein [Alloalcanivorax sp. C16-2]|uniref:tripartite tricarboxylate transporter substrate binding protein n=1 Tax=Alloalcanivorax TaxID=3020832 RepID=UPI0019329CA2|nr:tripartite tricarboxylate transporter substrate binding protein [Alloalcanivorax marinus]MBL7250508.1 tripartite tricarboxylate transporter substrate binding protein [Alloalcanivorax marinus]